MRHIGHTALPQHDGPETSGCRRHDDNASIIQSSRRCCPDQRAPSAPTKAGIHGHQGSRRSEHRSGTHATDTRSHPHGRRLRRAAPDYEGTPSHEHAAHRRPRQHGTHGPQRSRRSAAAPSRGLRARVTSTSAISDASAYAAIHLKSDKRARSTAPGRTDQVARRRRRGRGRATRHGRHRAHTSITSRSFPMMTVPP